MKKWYLLRGVEYSTDLKFFLENQIRTVKSLQNHIQFFSSLESFRFFKSESNLTTDEIEKLCVAIHKSLLNHRYGKGEFVD